MGWIKKFCFKVLSKIEDHFAAIVAGGIALIVSVLCIIFWEWLKTKRSFEIYNWMWLSILFIFLFLFSHFLRRMLHDRGRLKNPHDIINTIDNWFASDINNRVPIYKNGPHYFASVEKNLNLKRGSSKRYLPMVAWKHKYAFEMGKKTFKLTQITHKNDPAPTFERCLKKLSAGEKEILLSCNDIDRELRWPKGATKSFIINHPPGNLEFRCKIEDMGGDKIRVIRKE